MNIRRANINDIDNNLLNIFIDGFEFHLNGRKDIFDNNKKNDDLKKDLIDLIENKNVLVAEKNNNIYEFIENNEYFTLSFFSDEYKKDLSILGSKSGKDINKLSLTNLNAEYNENFVTYKEAVLTIICKKLYGQDLNIDNMSEEIKEKYYSNDPVHKMYIGEVIDIIDRR